MPVEKTCEECGKPFQTKPSVAEKRRFCSGRCKMLEQTRRMQAAGTWKRPQKPRRGTETPCPVCGKRVYAAKAQRERGMGIYCSPACHNAGMSHGRILKACAYCGKEMRLRPSYARIEYCSRRCRGDALLARPLDRMHNGRPARMDASGYVKVFEPDHPGAFHGWVSEHRLLAEKMIGRFLERDEEVHHRNGDKSDNRPDNLEILTKGDHATRTANGNWGRLTTLAEELEEYRRRFGPLTGE